ncbi:MAG: ABC-2 family transporter protein [Planctomycetota bacterium]
MFRFRESPYFALMMNAFARMLTYRLRYYTGILTYLVYIATYYFIWKALFASTTNPEQFGFTFPQMITYIAIGWIQRSFYFCNIDNTVAQEVQNGAISVQLLRPVNYQLLHLAQGMGESLFRLLLFTVPITLAALCFFQIQPPASITHGLAFVVASGFSFFIYAQMNFSIGILAVWITSIIGMIRIKETLIQLLSGLWIPISFFPEQVITLFQYLPFQAITYIPLQIYLGKVTGADLIYSLGLQAFWCLFLTLTGMGMLRLAIRRMEFYGG